jgi:tetratricopeptide (TPR) repeat protein
MMRALLPLLAAAALLAAPPARAQLGLDLGGDAPKEQPKKKGDKKKTDKKKEQGKKKSPPAQPKQVQEAPPTPPPSPEPAAPPPAAPLPVLGEPAEPAPPPPPVAPVAPPPRATRNGSSVQPGLSLAPADPKADKEAKERLAGAKKLLDEKATETAALAFDQILRDKRLSSVHDEARFQRAKALARLGLHFSALASFDDILEKGPNGSRFFHSSLEWLFWLGRKLPNEQPVLSRVARHASKGVPPTFEDRVNYFMSKYEFERGRALADAGRTGEARAAWTEARRLAARVKESAGEVLPAALQGKDLPSSETLDLHGRAKFLEGLIAYAEGNDAAATELFKDVIRLTNPKKARRPDAELRELAFLQLARIHYQNRQNRYAIFYYGKMPWGGQRWLEGLWEASYAHYRIGDYERALGNLLTLQSPYFREEYFPESYVLKAIIYYENCRYPEARQVLEQFSSLFEPVYGELTQLTAKPRTPDAYYDVVRNGEATGGIARRILKLAETDQAVAQLVDSIGAMEQEMDTGIAGRRPEFRDAGLGKELKDRLAGDRLGLVEEAGQRMRAKLEYERDQLRQLLAQALRIQIEVSRKEREALEGSLAKGSQVEVVKDLKFSYAVSDEHIFWPYEGEFWRDELGTYSYTLTKGCKDRLPKPRSQR